MHGMQHCWQVVLCQNAWICVFSHQKLYAVMCLKLQNAAESKDHPLHDDHAAALVCYSQNSPSTIWQVHNLHQSKLYAMKSWLTGHMSHSTLPTAVRQHHLRQCWCNAPQSHKSDYLLVLHEPTER